MFPSSLRTYYPLAKSLNIKIVIVFYSNFVTFQDLKMNKMIGKRSRRNNLYLLDQNSHALTACQRDNYILQC